MTRRVSITGRDVVIMNSEAPMATLRLSSGGLDPKVLNRILLSGGDLHDVRTKGHVWLVTTQGYSSLKAQEHLQKLTRLLADNIHELRQALPNVSISFSLLVFDSTFATEKLSPSLISSATEFGRLTIEVPPQGKEFRFDGHAMVEFAA